METKDIIAPNITPGPWGYAGTFSGPRLGAEYGLEFSIGTEHGDIILSGPGLGQGTEQKRATVQAIMVTPFLVQAVIDALVVLAGGSDDEWVRLGAKHSTSGDEFSATHDDVKDGVIEDLRLALKKAIAT